MLFFWSAGAILCSASKTAGRKMTGGGALHMEEGLLLHALREIWGKPPLLILASLILTVLAAFLTALIVIVFMGRRTERRAD